SPYPITIFFIRFFFNDTATTDIYTLSLHDALPIFAQDIRVGEPPRSRRKGLGIFLTLLTSIGALWFLWWIARPDLRHPYGRLRRDRKSTRLNSSHLVISYAVFCLKKKKTNNNEI